jgi:hypothetical protein
MRIKDLMWRNLQRNRSSFERMGFQRRGEKLGYTLPDDTPIPDVEDAKKFMKLGRVYRVRPASPCWVWGMRYLKSLIIALKHCINDELLPHNRMTYEY